MSGVLLRHQALFIASDVHFRTQDGQSFTDGIASALWVVHVEVVELLVGVHFRLLNFLFADVVVIPRKHHFVSPVLLPLFQRLHSIRIPQCVECVFTGADAGSHCGNHYTLAIAHEAVLQHQCQFASSEGEMFLSLIKGSYTLFEGQQTFADFCPIHLSLLV